MTHFGVKVNWEGQQINQEHLLQVFSPLGAIDVKIDKGTTQENGCSAFVSFQTYDEAVNAQDQTDGLVVCSTVLDVTICQLPQYPPAPIPMNVVKSQMDNIKIDEDIQYNQSIDYLQTSVDYGIYAIPSARAVTVNVLLSFKAPIAPDNQERPPLSVQLVIDNSGSMNQARKLEYAKIAGKSLIEKLEPRDMLAIVTFESRVNILASLASVTNKRNLIQIIDSIRTGGCTNISGGLKAGLNQVESKHTQGSKRVILLSDGHANQGLTQPEAIANIAAVYRANGVSVSAVGLGLDYNENLMQLMAQRGGGMYYYCGEAADLPKVFDTELQLAKRTVTHRTNGIITRTPCVTNVKVLELTTRQEANKIRLDMSYLISNEERQVLIQLTVDPSQIPELKSDSQTDSTKIDLGFFTLRFSRTEEAPAEQIEIPLTVIVDDNEERRDSVNGDETIPIIEELIRSTNIRSHVQSIERVAAFLMNAEANAARTRAVEEMERGNQIGAREALNQQQIRQQQFRQCAFQPQPQQACQQSIPDKYIGSSSQMQSRQRREVNPMAAVADFYSAILKLQPSLSSSSIPRNQSSSSSDSNNDFFDNRNSPPSLRSQTYGSPSNFNRQMINSRSTANIIHPLPPPISIYQQSIQSQSEIGSSLMNELFSHEKSLDEFEQELQAAQGNRQMQSHMLKQNKQRAYAQAQGIGSSAVQASQSSSSTSSSARRQKKSKIDNTPDNIGKKISPLDQNEQSKPQANDVIDDVE